ncbi:hypothetical protein Poli38472_000760 [Pythium oligandrum]|uniref:E2 ubiquitin-conjugating enzyme n=1 Tax=Pythium oligandrum TaxID=41045 RepID=A0A8K1FJG4_PYTOL|nr:hypothetical protein Poli38472_000760 [Pythium oligandrum]|eukprot:TMW60718.1 hypothetical protein Poli38472_000760 [Pythium oligandrum]
MTAMRARMRKEIEMLEADPPYGVSAWPKEDRLNHLEAQILGPEGSPYEKGVFRLDIEVPERYPFEPPKVKFLTPIYHPNIDDAGRICLDTLKMQPKGSWMPSVNMSTLLTTIRLLMAEPNADDGLMADITDQFKHNRELFNRTATEMTAKHACERLEAKPSSSTEAAETETVKEVSATKTSTTSLSDTPSSKKRRINTAKEGADDSFSDASSDFSDESDFSDDGDDGGKVKRRRKE